MSDINCHVSNLFRTKQRKLIYPLSDTHRDNKWSSKNRIMIPPPVSTFPSTNGTIIIIINFLIFL